MVGLAEIYELMNSERKGEKGGDRKMVGGGEKKRRGKELRIGDL